MFQYIIKRLLIMVPTFIGIMLVTFAVVHLAPGNPAELAGQQAMMSGADAEGMKTIVEETRAFYGLDKPVHAQFLEWFKRTLTLDFGVSTKDHRRVLDKLSETLPVTLALNIISILIIYLVAAPLGVLTALKANSFTDRLTSFCLLALYSLPAFWLAVILIMAVGGGGTLNWFPITGLESQGASSLPWYSWLANVAWHLCLPVACLVCGGFAFLSRFTRSAFLDVVKQAYITTARAKGLSEWKVMTRHALRNALIPMLSLMGTLLPALIGGSVVVEQIFSIPGMGRLGFESVLARDYPVIMAIAYVSAALVLAGILLTDILSALADPRVSFEKKRG